MQSNSDTATWIQFFKSASIPAQYIQLYANKFTEHRIRFDMLGDLDKSLLNEMGITAIGDCLCILKHAKLIINQIEEKSSQNEAQTTGGSSSSASSSSNSNTNSKKRSDVAKRIIETYLSDPDAKPLNEKTTGLSADLISRLNFNPTKITFNNDDFQTNASSSPKVIVSSTTSDDELRNKLKSNPKRKLDEEVNTNTDNTSVKIVKTVKLKEKVDGPALEYRGLLKNEPDIAIIGETSQVISLKPKRANTTSAALSLNERIRINQQPKTTNEGFKFENFKIETKNDKASSIPITFSDSKQTKTIQLGSLKSDSIGQSATSTTPTKPKIVPITFDKKPADQAKNINLKRSTSSKSIFDRITF